MAVKYCTLCKRMVDEKRIYSVPKIVLFIIFPFCWIFLLIPPMYSKKGCSICNTSSGLVDHNPGNNVLHSSGVIKNADENLGDTSYDERTCPSCAEIIKIQAIKCKHCGEVFDKDEISKVVEEHKKLRDQEFNDNFVLITDRTGEAICNACMSITPINGMYYHKSSDTYYHQNCLQAKYPA